MSKNEANQRDTDLGDILEIVAQQSRDAMFAVQIDGRILYANSAAEELYGYSLAEVQQLYIQDLLEPGDRQAVTRRLQESSEAGQCYRTIHRRKDGTLFPVEISSRRVIFRDDAVLVGVVRDLTRIVEKETEIEQRKQLLQRQCDELANREATVRREVLDALQKSEQKYRAIFDHAYSGICLMEAETARILDINRAECAICGFDAPHTVIGERKCVLLGEYPFSSAEYWQHFSAACTGAPQVFEWCYARGGGGKVWVEISLWRIPVAECSYILSLTRDITAWREHALELIKARASNLALIHAIPDTILVIHQDGSLGERWISEQDAAVFGNGDWQQHLADIFPGEVVYTISVAMKRAFEQNAVQVAEFWLAGPESSCYYEARLNVSGTDEIVLILRNATAHQQLHEQLTRYSTRDSLTELHNRRYFEERLASIVTQGEARIGVLICDVDGLKTVNDTLGHPTGDLILKTVACFLRDVFAQDAIIARIGGDEFAVVLAGAAAHDIENLSDTLKQRIELHNLACPSLPISVSTGFSSQLASELSGEVLFAEADNNMYREKMHQQKSGKSAVVQTLIRALEARDYITEGHCDRLQAELVLLAETVGLPKSKLNDLRLFAHFHDIGKVGVPDHILFKPQALAEAEWSLMKRHCEIGHRIAMASLDMAPIADWILKHHEWWNGQGYPLGLSGGDIPLECRLLAIVDAYDAMTNDRPYRQAMQPHQAIEELRRAAGSQFDPQLVELFVEKKLRPNADRKGEQNVADEKTRT